MITLNYNQIKVNDKYFELIKLDGNEGTANGKINIMTPIESGKYELIGYVILDPFEIISSDLNLVYTSARFTLSVD